MNMNSVKTKSIPMAAAIASVDPARTTIDLEPVPGATDWTVCCIVTSPRVQELWGQLHPQIGKPVVPLQSNPVNALAINNAIFKTSARLRDKTSTITRINCWDVCNG